MNTATTSLAAMLPILDWGRRYDRDTLVGDGVAALIVTIMLIPQEPGLRFPGRAAARSRVVRQHGAVAAVCIFGTSRALAVGPVAVVSLMTAGQFEVILGVTVQGYSFVELLRGLLQQGGKIHLVTAVLGLATLGLPVLDPTQPEAAAAAAGPGAWGLGLGPRLADVIAKAGPVVASH